MSSERLNHDILRMQNLNEIVTEHFLRPYFHHLVLVSFSVTATQP